MFLGIFMVGGPGLFVGSDLFGFLAFFVFLGISWPFLPLFGICWLIIGLIISLNWLMNTLELLSILFSVY